MGTNQPLRNTSLEDAFWSSPNQQQELAKGVEKPLLLWAVHVHLNESLSMDLGMDLRYMYRGGPVCLTPNF